VAGLVRCGLVTLVTIEVLVTAGLISDSLAFSARQLSALPFFCQQFGEFSSYFVNTIQQ